MDSFRYYVALFVVASAPGVFLFWFSIHPFVQFWRRVGPRLTLTIHCALIALLAAGVFLARDSVLAVEYGANPVLVGLAAVLLVVALVIRVHIHRVFGNRLLVGLPELGEESDSRLVTTGIYSRIRHPRYLQMLLLYLMCALFSNYLATYFVLVASFLWVGLLIPVEEKELRARFGEEYVRYAERVPRFLPRLSRRKR
jgi:protein-S-isoprenylcysteine O-methyltransferase Ste14